MSSKYDKGQYARTHEEARKIICCCCGRKVKNEKGKNPIKVIDNSLVSLVVKFVYCDYSVENISYPTALCSTCRLTLKAHEKVLYCN